jgi:PatG C-terminal
MTELQPAEYPTSLQPVAAVTEAVTPQASAGNSGSDCPTCSGNSGGASLPSFVYAIGSISPRFPLLSVEKEFAQATGRTATNGLTDRQVLHQVLTQSENRYLVRQLCWVMSIEGLETYILVPGNRSDADLLVDALRATPRVTDVDVVIGTKGPIAPPSFCNGLTIPIVTVDQIYSFDVDGLLGSIPRPEKIGAEQFAAVAQEVFSRVTQMADNAGDMDEHRALNYLVMRYPAIYAAVADAHAGNASLSGVEVRPSALRGTRRLVEVVFSFTNRATDVVEKLFTRVDVTEQFPFLVTKLSPYYDH